MNSTSPLEATQLTFGYHGPEDRLVLAASDGEGREAKLFLTRRMTGRVVNSLAQVLEQSSRAVRQAPAELRDDLILMEHQGVLQAESAGGKGAGASASAGQAAAARPRMRAGPARLVRSIDITTKRLSFVLTFHDAKGAHVRLEVKRSDLHRILDALTRQAEAAEWNITLGAHWLDPAPEALALN